MKINKWKGIKQSKYAPKDDKGPKVTWFVDGKQQTTKDFKDDYLAKNVRVVEYQNDVIYIDINMSVLDCAYGGVNKFWSIQNPDHTEIQKKIIEKHREDLLGKEYENYQNNNKKKMLI